MSRTITTNNPQANNLDSRNHMWSSSTFSARRRGGPAARVVEIRSGCARRLAGASHISLR